MSSPCTCLLSSLSLLLYIVFLLLVLSLVPSKKQMNANGIHQAKNEGHPDDAEKILTIMIYIH